MRPKRQNCFIMLPAFFSLVFRKDCKDKMQFTTFQKFCGIFFLKIIFSKNKIRNSHNIFAISK